MTLNSQDEELSALSGKKPESQNPASAEIESTVSSTSDKVSDITNPIQDGEEDIETKRNSLMEKLDELGEELSAALGGYHTMFSESYGYIDAQNMNIEYASDDELKNLNTENIEVSALFGGFDPLDKESVMLYNSLLDRLKRQLDAKLQAHLLGYMELLSVYHINLESNKKTLEEDEFKRIVFENPKLNPSYNVLIKRVFDMMDKDSELMVDISTLLHKNHGNKLTRDIGRIAEQAARIFE